MIEVRDELKDIMSIIEEVHAADDEECVCGQEFYWVTDSRCPWYGDKTEGGKIISKGCHGHVFGGCCRCLCGDPDPIP